MYVKFIMHSEEAEGPLTTIVFENTTPKTLMFPEEMAMEISQALNTHFARRARHQRETEHNTELKLLTHERSKDETDGGEGPQVA